MLHGDCELDGGSVDDSAGVAVLKNYEAQRKAGWGFQGLDMPELKNLAAWMVLMQ